MMGGERHHGMDRERGIALVAVLWLIAIAGLQVSLFNVSVRDAVALAETETAISRGHALLHAGVELAISRLTEQDRNVRWEPDGADRVVAYAGTYLTIRITPESSRIDINRADPALIAGLVRNLTGRDDLAATLADRIVDWRDTDDKKLPLGAERADYGRAAPDQSIGNRPFLQPEEMTRVLGLPRELAERMQPFVTAWSGDGKVNPLYAPPEVLAALPGISPNDIAYLVQLRGNNAPPDAIAAAVAPVQRFLGSNEGPAYRIDVRIAREAVLAVGRVQAIVVRGIDTGAPYRVLSWRYEPRK